MAQFQFVHLILECYDASTVVRSVFVNLTVVNDSNCSKPDHPHSNKRSHPDWMCSYFFVFSFYLNQTFAHRSSISDWLYLLSLLSLMLSLILRLDLEFEKRKQKFRLVLHFTNFC